MSVDISLLLECRFGGTLLLCNFYNNVNMSRAKGKIMEKIKKLIYSILITLMHLLYFT